MNFCTGALTHLFGSDNTAGGSTIRDCAGFSYLGLVTVLRRIVVRTEPGFRQSV